MSVIFNNIVIKNKHAYAEQTESTTTKKRKQLVEENSFYLSTKFVCHSNEMKTKTVKFFNFKNLAPLMKTLQLAAIEMIQLELAGFDL